MDIVIIGAGGHGRVVLDIIRAENKHRPVGFLDGNELLKGQSVDSLPVLGDIMNTEQLKYKGVTGAIIAIGDNRIRREYATLVENCGLELINAIHPTANIASASQIGNNVVIAAGAMLCAHCRIGDSAILNTGSIVDHESVIGTAAHICPGSRLAGRVMVQSGAFVGIGATVIQNITIGTDAVVGAGAVVIRDVPAGCTVVGVPARMVRSGRSAAVRFPANVSPPMERHPVATHVN